MLKIYCSHRVKRLRDLNDENLKQSTLDLIVFEMLGSAYQLSYPIALFGGLPVTPFNESFSLPAIPHLLLPLPPPEHINLTALILTHHNCWNATPHQCPLLLFFPTNESFLLPPCSSIQMPLGNYISMFLYTVVCIVGLLGNTLVIYVILRFSKMQTVTNIYILNLAFADECFLIGIPFLLTTMHLGEWTFGTGMCKAFMVSTSITQFTSSIFLFIMSADRYLGRCK